MTFVTEKLEWFGYPMVKKKLKIRLLVLTECTNVTDGWTYTQTDTQTPHDGIASRGKNQHQMLYGTLNDPDYITAL